MNALLLQINLAQRNNELDSWMNILFVVVLAIFWLIGGIIKAKANKSEVSGKGDLPRKPPRKPPLHSREAREQMLRQLERPADTARGQRQQPRPAGQKPRMKFADFQAAVRKFAAEAEKAFEADIRKPAPKPGQPSPVPKSGRPAAVPQVEEDKSKLAEPFTEPVKGLQDKQAAVPAELSEPEYLWELLTDYSDPDVLRRAILHFEILGKPLSLRDPSENSIGL